MKTYEDKNLRNRVQTIIQAQKAGKLLVDSYKTGFGLIAKDELGAVLTRAPYPHDFLVGTYGWLDYERDAGMYLFTLKPGAEMPPALKNYQTFSLAEGIINAKEKTVKIQVVETLITFTGVPVWEPGYNLLRLINEELGRKNAGVVIWKLDWENEDASTGLFEGAAPKLGNAHASVTLTGYAFDPQDKALVYFGCVGYKTSIESIRATLITNKPLSLIQPGGNDQMVLPLDRYEHVWLPMPEYTSHHACFVTRTALPGKWEPEDETAYLLVFKGTTDPKAEIHQLFIDRLVETLEVPILDEWADTLWSAAVANSFIVAIEVKGDCLGAARVALKADWKGLIEQLLLQGEIQIA